MLGKARRIWGKGGGGGGLLGKEEGEQLKEMLVVGLVIRGTSQNGGRRGGENGEAKRRVTGERGRKGVFVCLHVIITL